MRVPLKGVNTVRKRTRNGDVRHYHYAWKGGPRLLGKKGSPEFHLAYSEAHKSRLTKSAGDTLMHIFESYLASTQFAALRPRTRKDYRRHIITIEREFGEFPLVGLEDRRARGDFLNLRDHLAAKSRRQADYAFAVLALMLAWGRDRGIIAHNPCVRGGRVYKAERSDKVWTQSDIDAFLAAAPPRLRLPFKLALWTGQRQGDLLQLRWSGYDGETL